MNNDQINEIIGQLSKRIQGIADIEAQAAWAKFLGVTSDRIEAITNGSLDGERELLIRKINKFLDEL